jgi:hypothetical protein
MVADCWPWLRRRRRDITTQFSNACVRVHRLTFRGRGVMAGEHKQAPTTNRRRAPVACCPTVRTPRVRAPQRSPASNRPKLPC